MKIFNLFVIFGLLSLFIITCGGSRQGSRKSRKGQMSLDDAQMTVLQFKENAGVKVVSNNPPPSSMANVLAVLLEDDIAQFDASRQFARGKLGIDALYIRAMLELSWAGMLKGTSILLAEMTKVKEAEKKQISSREAHGSSLTDDEEKIVKELSEKIYELKQVIKALLVIADFHISQGSDLLEELVRQFPNKSQAYVVKAYSHRLNGQWTMFDAAIKKAETLDTGANYNIKYQRAMEKLERFNLEGECREALEKLREEVPNWIRIQAVLVLVQDDIKDTYEQLQILRKKSPNHLVVQILGDVIDEQYQIAKEINQ